MDTLQLQDVFQPYFAGHPVPSEGSLDDARAPREAASAHRDDMRKRLERCRARLASAIAAEAGR